MQVDANGHDVALDRIALTNAAAMLDDAAANPALGVNVSRPCTHAIYVLSHRNGDGK